MDWTLLVEILRALVAMRSLVGIVSAAEPIRAEL
jgi:hypothetical protein